MDPVRNPFVPNAGSRPSELAGREEVTHAARVACKRAMSGRLPRCQMLLGLRGTGKTVLLNEFGRIGREEGLLVSHIEAPEHAELAKLLIPEINKTLRSLSGAAAAKHFVAKGMRGLQNLAAALKLSYGDFSIGIEGADAPEPGLADTGNLELDLPDLFATVGEAASASGKAWLLLIDEVQYLNSPDLAALIVALHRMSQMSLPVAFAGAGLPQVARLAGDAKSYAERLFEYPAIGALPPQAAQAAIEHPIAEEGAAIEPAAVHKIVEVTKGYPFFLQEWGSMAWDRAEGPKITLSDVDAVYDPVLQRLDHGFFKVRMDRLTRGETEFVAAMASLGQGPYPIADIAKVLGKETQSLGPARSKIINKGMIYSAEHGYLAFTVPLFSDFMRRQANANQIVQ